MTETTNETFLSANQVRHRYGGRSHMWIERRLADPESGFPRPTKFGRLRFWKLAEIEAWERAQATKQAKTKNAA